MYPHTSRSQLTSKTLAAPVRESPNIPRTYTLSYTRDIQVYTYTLSRVLTPHLPLSPARAVNPSFATKLSNPRRKKEKGSLERRYTRGI